MEPFKSLAITPIKDLKPGMRDINIKAIVLDAKSIRPTTDGHTMYKFKIGDDTACVDAVLWDSPGSSVRPSDILVIPKAMVKIFGERLYLYANIQEPFKKIGDFCLLFNESVNMSEPKKFSQYETGESAGPSSSSGGSTSGAIMKQSRSAASDDVTDKGVKSETVSNDSSLQDIPKTQPKPQHSTAAIREILSELKSDSKSPGVKEDVDKAATSSAVEGKKTAADDGDINAEAIQAGQAVKAAQAVKAGEVLQAGQALQAEQAVQAGEAAAGKTSERVTRLSLKKEKK